MSGEQPYATGGWIQFGDGPPIPVESCTVTLREPIVIPEGVTMSQNWQSGFTVSLTDDQVAGLRTLMAVVTVESCIDGEWVPWRCPACGKSHDEIEAGHWWRVDGAGNAACGGQS